MKISGIILSILLFAGSSLAFSPLDVDELWCWIWAGDSGANCSLTTAGTHYGTDGSPCLRINYITDQSGNGRDWYQTIEGYMPEYASAYRNGLDGIGENAGNHRFTQRMQQKDTLEADGSFYIAIGLEKREGTRAVLGTINGNYLLISGDRIMANFNNPCSTWVCNLTTISPGGSLPDSNNMLLEVWRDGNGDITTYINGEDQSLNPKPNITNTWRISGYGGWIDSTNHVHYHWDNTVYEYVICDALPSVSVRDSVREYLRAKWAFYGSVDGEDNTMDSNPQQLTLLQGISPNPFNQSTRIRFSLKKKAGINISVFNLSGKLVSSIIQGTVSAGTHLKEWDSGSLATGLYLVKMTAGKSVSTRRIYVMK